MTSKKERMGGVAQSAKLGRKSDSLVVYIIKFYVNPRVLHYKHGRSSQEKK
jgi:hypothetical protein